MTARSRLRIADALALGLVGVRARRTRSALSALGIAIAIAALVAVLGITASSTAQLLDQLGAQSNLLTVAPGQTFGGDGRPLPATAPAMIAAVAPVRAVATVAQIPGATVRRTAAIPPIDTGGITVLAASPPLLGTISARLATGHALDAVADRYPEVLLGAQAAATLGVTRLDPATQVYIGGTYMTVVGVLAPVDVAPELDEAALVSPGIAGRVLHANAAPTRIYLRADPDQVAAVAAVLPFTTSPAEPEAVEVRRPSDVLVARLAAKSAFTGLFLGLGAVALLVGGVGIANIMVISVLERRGEIGVRRALGARAVHVGWQFLGEALVLAVAGGLLGAAVGATATVVTARLSAEPAVVPASAVLAGFASALAVGALAGIYPAVRAARLAPAEALRAL